MLSLNAGFLRQKGFDVTEASDGDQAWSLAEGGGFDLVLLDVMMPGMSGWEVCKLIKNTPTTSNVAVVMLTGIGETLNDMTSGLFLADAWLNKPYDFGELERKLREALTRYGKEMPDGASAFYARNDEPPPSLPSEELGPAIRKAKATLPKSAGKSGRKPSAKKAAHKPAARQPAKAARKPAKAAAKASASKSSKANAKKPAAKKPATKKPATKRLAAKKPATKKPATKKPATKKPAARKKKPATKKR